MGPYFASYCFVFFLILLGNLGTLEPQSPEVSFCVFALTYPGTLEIQNSRVSSFVSFVCLLVHDPRIADPQSSEVVPYLFLFFEASELQSLGVLSSSHFVCLVFLRTVEPQSPKVVLFCHIPRNPGSPESWGHFVPVYLKTPKPWSPEVLYVLFTLEL